MKCALEALQRISFDIPEDDQNFPDRFRIEVWLRKLMEGMPRRAHRIPPDSTESARQLTNPENLAAFKSMLLMLTDPFEGPRGEAIALYEWASYHLKATPRDWNFDAKVGGGFFSEWHWAEYDSANDEFRTLTESREIRRRLLIGVGLLKDEDTTVPPSPPHGASESPRARARMNPGVKAVAAAYQLKKSRRPVSLKAACELAGVDRKNVSALYPGEVKLILSLSAPDRAARRGTIDRRTGNIEAVDEDDE